MKMNEEYSENVNMDNSIIHCVYLSTWENHKLKYTCKNCKYKTDVYSSQIYNYCPCCGAKIDTIIEIENS